MLGDFFLHLLASCAMVIPTALGYNLILGKGKIFHFGPLGVSLAAAYGSFLTLEQTGSYAAAFAVGAVCALAISALFAWLSFRLEADGLGILSIAMHLAILTVVLNWSEVTRGAMGLPRIPRLPYLEEQAPFTLAVILIAVVLIAFFWLLDRSAFGRKLQAIAEHEWHAQSLGISRVRAHCAAFLIGGIAVLIGNVFYHQYIHLVHPNDFGFPALIFLVMVVVAGKPGSVTGVSISAIVLTLLKEGLRFLPFPASILGPMRLLLFGVILLAAVWYRRDSLFPKKRTI